MSALTLAAAVEVAYCGASAVDHYAPVLMVENIGEATLARWTRIAQLGKTVDFDPVATDAALEAEDGDSHEPYAMQGLVERGRLEHFLRMMSMLDPFIGDAAAPAPTDAPPPVVDTPAPQPEPAPAPPAGEPRRFMVRVAMRGDGAVIALPITAPFDQASARATVATTIATVVEGQFDANWVKQ